MRYLEWQRVLRVYRWFFGIALVLGLFIVGYVVYGVHTLNADGRPIVSFGDDASHVSHVPLDWIFAIAGAAAMVVAVALGGSFNRETVYAHFTFVLPVGRVRQAMQIAAVDVAAIVVAYLAIAGWTAAMLRVGNGPYMAFVVSPRADVVAVSLSLGAALSWYAILQLVTAWAPMKAGGVIGITCAILGMTPAFVSVPLFGPLFRAIAYIDPLEYLSASVSNHTSGSVRVESGAPLGISHGFEIAIVWAIVAVALVAATALWTRVEVRA